MDPQPEGPVPQTVESAPPPPAARGPEASDTMIKPPPRKRAKRVPALTTGPVLQPQPDGSVRMLVRSWPAGLELTMDLTEPGPDEECSITLERIADYSLDFVTGCVVKAKPQLTKATLPCGHGFSAMALLYHFAQNSMTCPCCRSGHTGAKMSEPSIPAHVRRPFLRQLDKLRMEERREQVEADALTAAHLLEREVNNSSASGQEGRGFELFLRVNRVVLILYAYESVDSLAPLLVQELPLSSSPTQEETQLTFASSGFYLRQLAVNLQFLPQRAGAFEAVVATRNLFDGVMELHRSMRFQPGVMGEGGPVAGTTQIEGVQMRVEMLAGARAGEISKIAWTIPKATLAHLLVWSLGREAPPPAYEF